MISPPALYENPRGDDPWDNDALYWLLDQPGGAAWSRFDLGECLRHQPGRLKKQAEKVREAEAFASRHGVRWVETPFGKGTIFRLYRSDPAAPRYPADEVERRRSRRAAPT